MPIIYSESPAPWKTSQASITTFESGLLRVDQEYLVPTADLAEYYPQFLAGQELSGINSPALDGLYIYPTPQFTNKGYGLTAINVSAYGRVSNQVTDASYFEERVQVGEIPATRLIFTGDFDEIFIGPIFSRVSFSIMQREGSIVIPANENIFALDFAVEAQQFAPFNFSSTTNPFDGDAPMFDLSVNAVTPRNIAANGTVWYEVKLTQDGVTGEDNLKPPFIYWEVGAPYPNRLSLSTPLVMEQQRIEVLKVTNFGYWTEYEIRTVRPMTYFRDYRVHF